MQGERGFSIIEALIAGAIVVVAAFVALAVCRTTSQVTARFAGGGATALDAQITAFEAEAATALGVFTPPGDERELDFFTTDASGTELRWKYAYDAVNQTLIRSDCTPLGECGVRDPQTGQIDTRATYPPLRNVVGFTANAIPAPDLMLASRNAYAGVATLFGAAPAAVSIPLGSTGTTPARGGNSVVEVTLATTAATHRIHLLAGVMPSGFTVTGLPLWHAIVYRVDQTHRFGFGFIGKSHVFINARIDVTYDRWQSRKVWCDFNLLGDPDGLDGHDPHADFKPDEPIESAASILAACRAIHPQPPPRDAQGYAALSGPPPPPVPPPSCWTDPGADGRCWPAGVPPDWAPPSPAPRDSPPPQWCATHRASPACPASTPVRRTE